jgi:CBS domain containing-hemolysin-like protein
MDNDTDSEEQDPDQEKGFLQKLVAAINFKKPGTKEELEHDIQELLEEGEEHGLISQLEERMINSILEFRDTNASEIMTPAAEVVSFDESAPMSELIEIVIDSGLPGYLFIEKTLIALLGRSMQKTCSDSVPAQAQSRLILPATCDQFILFQKQNLLLTC